LEATINNSIEELEGAVFPKVNWHSPLDATWMSTSGTLKCSNAEEIILLLKSSDIVGNQILHSREKGLPFILVLRKWYDLKPSMEFRCFVKDNVLIGISQRDASNYYSHLKESKDSLKELITNFFHKAIKDKFFEKTFIFDAYIVSSSQKVYVVDFSPWLEEIDSLLFEWDELNNWNTENQELRIVTSQIGIQPSLTMRSMLPFDMKDASLPDLIEKMEQITTHPV